MTNQINVNCSLPQETEEHQTLTTTTQLSESEIMGVMKHECEEPFNCTQCLVVCYPIFLTALDIEEIAGVWKAAVWIQEIAELMPDRGVKHILTHTLKWRKQCNLCRKKLLSEFEFREKYAEERYPEINIDASLQEIFKWNTFIGKDCPDGFNTIRKKYVYASEDRKYYTNHRGKPLRLVPHNSRPTLPALHTDPAFNFLMNAQSNWNMTRKELSRFSEHTKQFERWVREHGIKKEEIQRFIGIHKAFPQRFLRQTQTSTLSPVAWKFVKNHTDIITVEYKKDQKYKRERAEKYMAYDGGDEMEAQVFPFDISNSIGSVGDSITQASENISRVGAQMTEQMASFNDTFDRMTRAATGADQTTASRIMSTLHLMATLITQLNPMMYLKGGPLAIHIASVIAWWSTSPSLLAVFGPLVTLIKGCVGTAFVGQSGNDSYEEETIIGCFKEYFCTALGMSACGKLNESRGRRIDLLCKTVMNASKLANLIWKCFHLAMEWMLKKLDMMDTQTLEDRMTAFTIAADTFDLDETNPDAYRKIETREDMKDLATLITVGRKLTREIAITNPRINGPVIRSLNRLETKFRQIRAYHFKETGAEMEPVAVWIEGAAGTGKTMLMDQLMADVFAIRGKTYDNAYHKYVISKDSEYYDGLCGQPVIVLDDVFVVNDPESDKIDIARIVSLTDGSVKHVNMADCDLKSCTYATPEFVLMTSNATPGDSDLIGKMRAPDALMRRLDLIVKTTNKPGQGFEDQQFIFKEFRFATTGNPHSSSRHGSYVVVPGKSTYADLVEIVTRKYFEHRDHRVSTEGRLSQNDIEVIRQRLCGDKLMQPVKLGETSTSAQASYGVTNLRVELPPLNDYVGQVDDSGSEVHFARSMAYDDGDDLEENRIFRDTIDEFIEDQIPYLDDLRATGCNVILPGETWRERAFRYYACVKGKVPTTFPIGIGRIVTRGKVMVRTVSTYWETYSYLITRCFAAYMIYSLVYHLAKTTYNYFVQPIIDKMKNTVKDYATAAINKMSMGIIGKNMKNSIYDSNDIIDDGHEESVHCHSCAICQKTLRHRGKLLECKDFVFTCQACEFESQSSPESKVFSGAKAKVVRLKNAQKLIAQSGKIVPRDISEQFAMHSASDTAAVETFYATSRNYVTIQRTDRAVSVQGFVLQGNIVCTVGHFLSDLEFEDESVTLIVDSVPVSGITFKVAYKDLLFLEGWDGVCFRLPKNVVTFRSIVHHFVDEEPVSAVGVMMPRLTISGNRCVLTEKFCSNYRALGSQQYKYDGNYIITTGCGAYNMPTEKGDCGNLIYVVDPSKSRKIVGYHIAGNGSTGICKVLTRHDALDIVRQMSVKFPCATSVAPVIDDEVDIDCDLDDLEAHSMTSPQPIWEGMGYHPIGTSDVNIVGSGKSQFVPSIIHGKVYDVTHKPSKLRTFKNAEGERVDPLHRGEVNKTDKWVPFEKLDSIVDNMHDNLKMYPDQTTEKRLLTEMEAINGVYIAEKTLHPWIGSMEMKTSAGLPFVKRPSKGKGKTGLFEFREGQYAMLEEVRAEYEKLKISVETEDEVLSCVWPVFTDTKKDELLVAAKADAGRTRIFNVGPVHFNILCREYFGMFNAHIMANHNYGEVKVGLNVHSDEWRIFYNDLTRDSDPEAVSFLAGDWSGWDKSLSYQFCMMYVALANKWYNDGHDDRRTRLGQMMFSSFRQNGDQLYRVYGSLPSGIVMTAVGNSVINMAISRYVFMRCVEDCMGDWKDWTTIWQNNVRCGFYGDDAIYTVTNRYVDVFNMQAILKYGEEIGMKYTAPDKSAYVPKTMRENEVTFIKRRFVKYQGLILAPLEWVSLCNMTNWRRSDMDARDAVKAMFNSFQIELLHYGMAVYTTETDKLREGILKEGVWVEQKDWLRLFGEVWGHFATLSYVDKTTRIVNILDAAVDDGIHHIRRLERHPNGKLKDVDWCPMHMENIGQQLGGKAMAHHVCMGCKKVVLATFDDTSKCVKNYCLACLGSPVPGWYYHNGCLECM